MTTYTTNKEHNGIEITFTACPSASIREELKAAGFHWHNVKKVWFAKNTAERLELAQRLSSKKAESAQTSTTETANKAETPGKEEIRAEFAKAWDTPRMAEYCTGKVAAVAVLPSGEWVTVEKQRIETGFCFGESGYDIEDAQHMAHVARTSADYVKAANMKDFLDTLKDLEEAKTQAGRYFLTINSAAFSGQKEDCRLRSISFQKTTKVLEDLGGSACLKELPGQTITEAGSGRKYRIATAEEIEIIRSAYEEAAKAHEKKIDAYLKRYGTSKVHSWTYWREA